jgi:hypothetical protein
MNEKMISKHIREKWFQCAVHSFENITKRDVPDLYIISQRVPPFWVEIKVVESSNCVIPFRKGQPQWLDNHNNMGGRAFVLVYNKATEAFELLSAHSVRLLATKKLIETAPWRIGIVPKSAPLCWTHLQNLALHQSPHNREP